jgi:putative ATPase
LLQQQAPIRLQCCPSGVKDQEVIQEAGEEWKFNKRRTILFVDEIWFNKAQQDAFFSRGERTIIYRCPQNPF